MLLCLFVSILQFGFDISLEEMVDLGIGGIGGVDDDDDDDDDESFEVELVALQGELYFKVKKKSKYFYIVIWNFLMSQNSFFVG